jgi:ribose/xylose/arabinose/galactoside ABC-type transport system permease subunit
MKFRRASLTLVAFFVAAIAFFSLLAPRFATSSNVENLMAGYSFVAIVAMGQAFPILLRGIDLSIGAIVALVGMVVFDLSLLLHVPGPVVLPLALLTGVAAGALNGVLIVGLRLQPFIVTLATLAAYRGLVYSISGRQIAPELSTRPITDPWIVGIETYFNPNPWLGLPRGTLPWIPLSFLLMLGMFVVLQVLLTRTRFGRDIYAVGGNAEAARLAGIGVGRVTIAAYAIAGLCAAVTALIMVARFTTATEALGTGMELTAIAAAVIGGVSLSGGVGSMFGPMVGAFLLGVVLLGLTLLGVPQFTQQIITGVILLVAISYDRLLLLRRRRAQAVDAAQAA